MDLLPPITVRGAGYRPSSRRSIHADDIITRRDVREVRVRFEKLVGGRRTDDRSGAVWVFVVEVNVTHIEPPPRGGVTRVDLCCVAFLSALQFSDWTGVAKVTGKRRRNEGKKEKRRESDGKRGRERKSRWQSAKRRSANPMPCIRHPRVPREAPHYRYQLPFTSFAGLPCLPSSGCHRGNWICHRKLLRQMIYSTNQPTDRMLQRFLVFQKDCWLAGQDGWRNLTLR